MCVEYINVDELEGIVVDNSREVRYLNFLKILKEGTSQFMHKSRTILRVLRSLRVKLPITLEKMLRPLNSTGSWKQTLHSQSILYLSLVKTLT